MRIQHNEAVNAAQIGQVLATSDTKRSALPNQGSESASATSAATVSLSPAAQQIAQVTAAVNATPDIRHDLVNSLKAKIDSGTYNVSGKDIAEMIMRRHTADNAK